MKKKFWKIIFLILGLCGWSCFLDNGFLNAAETASGKSILSSPWKMHVIDNSSVGADGVRLKDVNGDGLEDIVTGWEEGGVVRAYLNPGAKRCRELWPAVTAGRAGSVEDAVFVDLDSDGSDDIVSSCEGSIKTVWIHWAPSDRKQYLNPVAWKTEALPASKGNQRWMFCLPMQVDAKNGVDLIVGGKNSNANIGWFESPPDPRKLSDWKWHAVYDAGWIMSLVAVDMDKDGDEDVVCSDRKGKKSGVFWLEHPSPGPALFRKWPLHLIGGKGKEMMFLKVVDLDGDGMLDVLTPIRSRKLIYSRRKTEKPDTWEQYIIKMPENGGLGKAVNVADIDLDGRLDIVFTCGKAEGRLSGVMWLSYEKKVTDMNWIAHDISGGTGIKYDLVQLIDVDHDGDLDAVTCEERTNLGVIWYENPAR